MSGLEGLACHDNASPVAAAAGCRKESAVEQQRRGNSGTGEKSCITMEFMVNAMELSTDRAWTGFEINPARNASKLNL